MSEQGKPWCMNCHGSGWTVDSTDGGIEVPCDCESYRPFPILFSWKDRDLMRKAVQSRSVSIPWHVARTAYRGYEKKYGGGVQSLEKIAERGGFGISELDEFHPKWWTESGSFWRSYKARHG